MVRGGFSIDPFLLFPRLQAAHVAPDSPEPLQVQASLQYELGDMEGALHLLRESMSKWWPPQHDSHNNVAEENAIHEASTQDAPMSGDAASSVAPQIQGHEQNDGSMATPPGQGSSSMPSYEFRVESCKLLLELDDSTEVVLEVLFSSDFFDESAKFEIVWYLMW